MENNTWEYLSIATTTENSTASAEVELNRDQSAQQLSKNCLPALQMMEQHKNYIEDHLHDK